MGWRDDPVSAPASGPAWQSDPVDETASKAIAVRKSRPERYSTTKGAAAEVMRSKLFSLGDEAAGVAAGLGRLVTGRGKGPMYIRDEDGRVRERDALDPETTSLGGYVRGVYDDAIASGIKYWQDVNESADQYRREKPVASLGTSLAAGLTDGAVLYNAIRGTGAQIAARGSPAAMTYLASKAPTASEMIGAGAIQGAITGYGYGAEQRDRNAGAQLGATVGAAVPAVATTVQAIAKPAAGLIEPIAKRFDMSPDQRALRLINRSVRRSGQPLKAAPQTGGPTEEAVFETAGDNVRGLARAVANVPGPGKDVARNFFETRKAKIWDRVAGAAAKATGKDPKDFKGFLDATKALRKAEAKTFYSAAYQDPPPANVMEDVTDILSTIDGRRAASLAARALDSAKGATKDAAERADIDQAIQFLSAAAKGKVGGQNAAPNMRALDYLGRGFRDIIGPRTRGGQDELARGPMAMRDRLIDSMRNSSRAYDTAFGRYGDRSSQIDYAELGRKALRMDDIEIADALKNANLDDKDAFSLGVARSILDSLNSNDTALIFRFQRSKGLRDTLEEAMGKTAFKGFQKRIAREAGMKASENSIIGGSRTTPLAEDIKDATGGEAELGFVSDMVRSGGQVRGPATRFAARAYDRMRRPGIYDPEVNAAVADRLYSKATRGNVGNLSSELTALENSYKMRLQFGRTSLDDVIDEYNRTMGPAIGGRLGAAMATPPDVPLDEEMDAEYEAWR